MTENIMAETPTSEAPTSEAPASGATTEPAANEGFSIPEAYAEKGWASKIKSQDDLFKQIDNLDSMVGKRQTPSDDASDEEWDEFFGKIGKPDQPDKYELTEPELPEGFNLPEDFKPKAQQIMHEAGLTQKQAEKLYSRFLEEEINVASQNKEVIAQREQELDKQFGEITNELFGDKFDEVSARAQNVIKDSVPENLVPELQSLAESNPKALAAVVALTDGLTKQIDAVKAKYGGEDNLNSGQGAQASSVEEVRKKIVDVRSNIKNLDPFSPDRKKAESELQDLQKQLQSFFN